jgi:hypothetical protein
MLRFVFAFIMTSSSAFADAPADPQGTFFDAAIAVVGDCQVVERLELKRVDRDGEALVVAELAEVKTCVDGSVTLNAQNSYTMAVVGVDACGVVTWEGDATRDVLRLVDYRFGTMTSAGSMACEPGPAKLVGEEMREGGSSVFFFN